VCGALWTPRCHLPVMLRFSNTVLRGRTRPTLDSGSRCRTSVVPRAVMVVVVVVVEEVQRSAAVAARSCLWRS